MYRQQTKESLQQRVSDMLHTPPLANAVKKPKEESVKAIFSLLQRAEQELKTAQKRVDRLKRELQKVRGK